MIFRQSKSHHLRMYIEDSRECVLALSASLYKKFFYENQYSNKDEINDIDNLIFEDEEGKYYFPSGIVSIVKDCANSLGYNVEVIYNEYTKPLIDSVEIPLDLVDGIELRDYQVDSIKASIVYKRGLVQSPTGSGKSSMMIGVCKYLLAHTNMNIIMCVPTTYLLHQTYENSVLGGIPENDLCKYGDGNDLDPSKRVIIATVQTLYRRVYSKEPILIEWLKDANCLIFDECQHASCRTWHTVADFIQPEYLLGFSAEPFYGDKEHMIRDLITRGTLGPVLYRISMKDLIERGYLSKPYVIAMNSKYRGNIYTLINWHSVNKSGIVENKLRNELIRDTSLMLIDLGKNPLILVQQIKHGKSLAEAISSYDKKVVMITGGSIATVYVGGKQVDSFKDDEGLVKKQFKDGYIDALIGTTTLDEGVDMPTISSVILAGGGKISIRLIQRLGRGLRPKKDDNTTFVIDFTDTFNVVLNKHFKLRKVTYDKNQIPVYIASNTQEVRNLIEHLRDNPPKSKG